MNTPRPWFASAYRRAVVDMHIPDWDERFLTEVDPAAFVANLETAKAQSIVLYAMSHVGLFNYPTKVGRAHAGLKGRNLVQELLERCHARKIAVILYNSLIFDRVTADAHPEWRAVAADGAPHGKGGRHGLLCPNSPYRDYVRAFAEEQCRLFDFDGVRFDMTFWPAVCHCKHCKKRFADEVGGELPTTTNWLDEKWVAFQRRREAWLAEFAAVATGVVRKLKPKASVEHQASTYPLGWSFGVNRSLVAQNDFLQGDFYGDSWQGSFVRKLLDGLTPNRPFGFETSFSMELADHTGLKPEPLLEAKASAAIADDAAFIFIDAIDPVGTLNPKVYERMGRVFDRLMPYYEHLGGQRIADVAVYYSLDSKFSFADGADSHTTAVTSATRWLASHHVPFTVVTRKDLGSLAGVRTLVLPMVNMMDDDEASAVRTFVAAGGSVYASGVTSLVDTRGRQRPDFALADVLGVSFKKGTRTFYESWPHYVAPVKGGEAYLEPFTAKHPAFARAVGVETTTRPGAKVLATTTLPWPAPDGTKFSSIHSNPPWQATDRPEVVLNHVGKGKAVYAATPLETLEPLAPTFARLVRLLSGPCRFEADAPAWVEVTLFRQPERHRYRLALVNFPRDLPGVAVTGVPVRLRLGEAVRRIVRLPGSEAAAHKTADGVVTFNVERLDTLALYAVETA